MRGEFTALIEREDEWFFASCLEIPGANGQGHTEEECLESLAEAITLIFTDRREDGLREAPQDAICKVFNTSDRSFAHFVIDQIPAKKTAFVSISYAHKNEMAAELDAIRAALAAVGIRAHVFVDAYTFTPDQQREMMAATAADLRAADLLIAEVTHKAIGVGIEVGYAAALGKPVIYLRRAESEPSTTVGGLAACALVYRSPDDLREQLAAALNNH